MAEDFQTRNEQSNTVATVGMRFSIIWLIALISIIFSWLSFLLLLVWFILWIIGLFYKPRGKARVAVCIPLVVFIAIISVVCYIWSSIKAPAKEFWEWIETRFEGIDEETFDKDRFNAITNEEFNNILSSMNEDEFTSMIENSTWSNIIEKTSYVIFWLLQQWFETSLERYENGDSPVIDNNENIIEIEIDNDESDNNNEINDSSSEKVGVFTKEEQNDIEQILGILE
jgi:hypothetical protein